MTFEFTSSPETLEAYPYEFKLNMTYAITGEATLTQTFSVTNTGAADMPFSVGGHPAFNVPAPGAEDEAFEDYVIEFAEPWTCVAPTIAEGGLLTFDETTVPVENADVLPVTRELFSRDAVMLTDVPDGTLTLRGAKSGRGVRIDFADFKYIGIWSACQGNSPFIALEPWTGHATLTSEDDVFEHKRNVTVIAPGESPRLLLQHDRAVGGRCCERAAQCEQRRIYVGRDATGVSVRPAFSAASHRPLVLHQNNNC